jgi:D-alanine-D-alanine ligase
VYDRPERVSERPGLARTYFAERCVSDELIDLTIEAFRSVGAYVELFSGEQPFLAALADGRLQSMPQRLKLAYNGIGWGVGVDGFRPGRKALIPLVADSYGLVCVNSDAYACALALHKFHSSLVLEALGVLTPRTWHYRESSGWLGVWPPQGMRVIAKSTYEAWSVGVTIDSVFFVDDTTEDRLEGLAADLGQPVTVQEFISGAEVCVPVISSPDRLVAPPLEAVVERAPHDPEAIMTVDDNLDPHGVSHVLYDGPPAVVERITHTTLAVFEALQLQGLSRVDFRVDARGRAYAFDVAVSPGIGRKSSAFLSLAALGFDHSAFLRAVVAATLGSEGLLAS